MGVAASESFQTPSDGGWESAVCGRQEVEVSEAECSVSLALHLPLLSRAQFLSCVFQSYGQTHLYKSNRILRIMLTANPYSTWPLHVKFFTEEALKCWNELSQPPKSKASTSKSKASTTALPPLPSLPPGFTSSIEFEGVDGNSGKVGSGRSGPICVTDGEQFHDALYCLS